MKRSDWLTYGACIGVSLLVHVLFFGDMEAASSSTPRQALHRVEMAVLQPKPKLPPPPPPPEPPKPKPKPPEPPRTPPRPQPLTHVAPPQLKTPNPPPPPNAAPPPPNAQAAPPMFGISMTSTVGAAQSTFSVPVGNTTMTGPAGRTSGQAAKPLRSVPSHAVSRLPKVKRDCVADYPPEARQLHIEGRVTLDVEVKADGQVGEVLVLSGLEHGLNQAAIAALKRCAFSRRSSTARPWPHASNMFIRL